MNKVNTKITIRWNVALSTILSPQQKEKLLQKLSVKLTVDGELILHAQDKRTQLQNKESALEKLEGLLLLAFYQPKARKTSKPSKAAKRKRLDSKKKHAEKKQWRKAID